MGWKGPMIIMIMGALGLIGLGMMADMLVRNPETQAVFAFREAIAAEYPVTRVEMKPEGRNLSLTLWMARSDYRAQGSGAGADLPRGFENLKEFLTDHYRSKRIPRAVHVEFKDIEDETRLLGVNDIQLQTRKLSIRRQIEAKIGKRIRLRTAGGGKLLLVVPDGTNPDQKTLAEVAALLSRFKHGNWNEIDIQVEDTLHQYNGLGLPRKKP